MTQVMDLAPEISFDRVSKTFGRPGAGDVFRAVDGLSLDIARGHRQSRGIPAISV